METVTMVHRRLAKRQVRKDVVRRMRQNGWSVEGETKAETPKGKSSKENQ